MSSHVSWLAMISLFLVFFAVSAYAQSTDSFVSTGNAADIENLLRSNGLPDDVKIVKVNDLSTARLKDPVVIVGSGIDSLERQLYDEVSSRYKLNRSHMVYDSARTFQGKSIESYDLIVVGGPLHNAYTNELLSRGVLKYRTTDLNKTGLVVESEKLSTGHTVVILGTTDGYTYLYKTPQNYTTDSTTQSLASPTPVPATESIGNAQSLVMINGILVYLPTLDVSSITRPVFQQILQETYRNYMLMDAYNSWHTTTTLDNYPSDFKEYVLLTVYQQYVWEMKLAGYNEAAAKLESYQDADLTLFDEEWSAEYSYYLSQQAKIDYYRSLAEQFLEGQAVSDQEE